jgi:divalent metal cation (Fe/Co/Zn/Cd) transporter
MKVRNIYRLIVAIVLIIAGLYIFQLALFHAWVAGHPLTKTPEPNETYSNVFLFISIILFIYSSYLIWRYKKVKKISDDSLHRIADKPGSR